MTDSSTTTAPILNLIAGDCWARRQLRRGIKDVSVASDPMKSLTIMVRVVFRGPLALPELDVRSLHDHGADSGSDCGRSLGPTPASQWCKVHPSATFIHEVTGLNGVLAIPELDDRFLHNHSSDPRSDRQLDNLNIIRSSPPRLLFMKLQCPGWVLITG